MITIIGAGPAGLALAYYLKKYDLPFQILEKDDVAASWASYYEHLRLHTRKDNIALPGLKMSRETHTFPTRDQFVSYLRRYAKHFAFPIKTRTELIEADYQNSWHLLTNQGSLETTHLVLATGIFANPVKVNLPGQEHFRGKLLHSKNYLNPEPFKNKSVLVVGAGNTGVGIALGLSDAGIQTGIVIRDGIQLVPRQKTAIGTKLKASLLRNLPRNLANSWLRLVRKDFSSIGLPQPHKEPREVTPVLGFELARAVKEEKIQVHDDIVRLNAAGALFNDGIKASYDCIILATGYRFNAEQFICQGSATQAKVFTLGSYYPTEEPFLMHIKKEALGLAKQLKSLQENEPLRNQELPQKPKKAQLV